MKTMSDWKPPKVVPGRIQGYYLETDEYTFGGSCLGGYHPFEMMLGPTGEAEPVRYSIDLMKYREEVYRAIQKVALMNLQVERITIIKGVVQAHPPTGYHWRCPFCYPEEEKLSWKPCAHEGCKGIAPDGWQFCVGHMGTRNS